MLMKQAPVAPIWTRSGVSYIIFRKESEYGTPGAHFLSKTSKIKNNFFVCTKTPW